MPEVKCFLQGAASRGLTWSRLNSNVLSDGKYASNQNAYQALKVDIQTKCKEEKFKRSLRRALRRMEDENSDDDDDDTEERAPEMNGDDDDDDKKKK